MKMKLKMEVLTPLHVGSGVEMLNGIDFIGQEGIPLVVDHQAVFEQLAEKGMDKLGAVHRIDELLHQLDGQTPGYSLSVLHGDKSVPERIRQQLKDAHWRALVPGSSLKGAIRTALMAERLRRQPPRPEAIPIFDQGKRRPSVREKVSSQKVAKGVFGKSPNFDWMRIWKVGDVAFDVSALRLADVRFMNLVEDPPVAGWKDMPSRKNFTTWKKAHGVHVEVLMPGAMAKCSIVLDNVLYQNAHRRLRWDQAIRDFERLRAILNAHAHYRLERERNFYLQRDLDVPWRTCEQVQDIMKRDAKAIYLQMGWGNGWRGMTGDWQEDVGIEKQMRRLYRLGKKEYSIFPKTRRLAVAGGEPSLPFGWVRLWLESEDNEIRRGGILILNKSKETSTGQAGKPEERQNMPNSEPDAELLAKLEELKKKGIGGRR
jgi:CRISPR type III-A-associated RAMP protein Csm5